MNNLLASCNNKALMFILRFRPAIIPNNGHLAAGEETTCVEHSLCAVDPEHAIELEKSFPHHSTAFTTAETWCRSLLLCLSPCVLCNGYHEHWGCRTKAAWNLQHLIWAQHTNTEFSDIWMCWIAVQSRSQKQSRLSCIYTKHDLWFSCTISSSLATTELPNLPISVVTQGFFGVVWSGLNYARRGEL